MSYVPSQIILERYADVMVNFAVGNGKGVKKNEVVLLEVPECAKPLLVPLQKAVLKAGAHYITHYIPEGTSRYFYELAEDHQLDFFADKLLKGRIDQVDHSIAILSTINKKELEGIDPIKIMKRQKSHKPYMDWRHEKEGNGKYSWTLCMYGTEAMAKEAGLSIEDYWDQIIKACFLDNDEPIKKWKETYLELEKTRSKLNSIKIENLHVKSKNVDLNIKIGKNRKWLGGRGANIPSFELYISPDWRGTNGKIKFDMPLYRYGVLIEGIELEFKDGKVVKSKAKTGENVLKQMIATENADKAGEYSLTDKRFSRINRFMAENLFDENFGGRYGNTHLALGNAYRDSYPGEVSKVKKEQWKEMGYNESVVHTDIISTEDRVVTAELEDGSKKVIYKDGMFCL